MIIIIKKKKKKWREDDEEKEKSKKKKNVIGVKCHAAFRNDGTSSGRFHRWNGIIEYRRVGNEGGGGKFTSSVTVCVFGEAGDDGIDGLFEDGFGFEIVGVDFGIGAIVVIGGWSRRRWRSAG